MPSHASRTASTLVEQLLHMDDDASGLAIATSLIGPAVSAEVGCSYVLSTEGPSLEHGMLHGLDDGATARLRLAFDRLPPRFGHYDPHRPEPWQRNEAFTFDELATRDRGGQAPPATQVFEQVGIGGCDQLRVLVCDGPILMAWLGAFRVRRFGAAEKRTLQRVVPALRTRLRFERMLGMARLHAEALDVAMQAMGAPALLIGPRGTIATANDLARDQLGLDTRRSTDVAAELSSVPGFTSLAVRARGVPEHRLVIGRARAPTSAATVRAAALAWRLTPRQTEVAALLVEGHPNKTIAARLGCANATVEVHVTAILAKAGVESRAALVATLLRRASS